MYEQDLLIQAGRAPMFTLSFPGGARAPHEGGHIGGAFRTGTSLTPASGFGQCEVQHKVCKFQPGGDLPSVWGRTLRLGLAHPWERSP